MSSQLFTYCTVLDSILDETDEPDENKNENKHYGQLLKQQ
jgi:hypothetical protein